MNTTRYWGANNVFLDPASPVTYDAISNNGQEIVATETASLSLTSSFTPRWISHLRAQFSRDQQQSYSNTSDVLVKIPTILDGMGRSNLLPRQTREHRLHLAETVSSRRLAQLVEVRRRRPAHLDLRLLPQPAERRISFLSHQGRIRLRLQPMEAGLPLTPLRAYAHEVPHYYLQNFGSATSHPDTNEYAAFAQDTIRVTDHLAVNLGVRWDLQTFTTAGLLSNPLFPPSGKVPFQPYNFAPRAGFAYSFGKTRPLVVRAGYGIFFVRIPQIYNSVVQTENGITDASLFLNNTNYYDHQVFPTLSQSAGELPALRRELRAARGIHARRHQRCFCLRPQLRHAARAASQPDAGKRSCGPHHGLGLTAQRSRRTPDPRARRESAAADGADLSHLRFHRIHLPGRLLHRRFLRHLAVHPHARLPVSAVHQSAGTPHRATGRDRRIPERGLAAYYNGATLSINRRVARGTYLRLSYTYAHAIDDGQDALVAGQPATVQNSYDPSAERGPSVTDQRHRLVVAFSAEPRPFHRGHEFLGHLFNDWKISTVVNYGSGRPFNATVSGDPNQDGNDLNDRLPGYSRNAFTGPDYATTDLRLTRQIRFGERYKLNLVAESFNLFNRDNQRVAITSNGTGRHRDHLRAKLRHRQHRALSRLLPAAE